MQRLCAKPDGHALLAALGAHFAPPAAPAAGGRGAQGVGVDGKAQRGRLPYEAGGCPVHALTACCHDHAVVLAHAPIERGADKAEGELTDAPALLARVDWRGRVFTGDALCRQVVAADGDDLLLVKEHQPTLVGCQLKLPASWPRAARGAGCSVGRKDDSLARMRLAAEGTPCQRQAAASTHGHGAK